MVLKLIFIQDGVTVDDFLLIGSELNLKDKLKSLKPEDRRQRTMVDLQ